MKVHSRAGRLLAHILVNAMFWQPVIVLADGITIDGRAGGNTAMDRAGNGVPVVDIATPNGRGLSHNTFSDYNVGKEGVILNNATDKLQSTKLGGMIVGNPNLKGQAAQLIVNEVNGGRASQLRGYTEVAGQAANVVVANPYGITCNGCGFINSPRVTLSTGKPMIEDGALDRFAVDQGQVTIEGLGLDASEVDQFDIVTRTAKLNGELHARQLNIVTGRNDVDATSLTATARKGSDDAPALSIDASALGAMYAGSIHLVGTEAGVGVRLAGDMAATAGDITIDTQGHLALNNAAAQRDIDARATAIDTRGSQHARNDVRLNAREDMGLYGNLSSGGDTTLTAGKTLAQQGQVIAGIEGNQRINGRRLAISADRIDNRGHLDASQTLQTRSGQLSNSGQLLADEISIRADDGIDNTGTLQGRRVRLETAALTNGHNDAVIDAEQALELQAPVVTNRGTLQFGKSQDVTLDLIRLDNRDGRFVLNEGALELRADTLFNDRGTLQAESLRLAGRYVTNREGGLIVAASGNATLVIEQQLDNSGGQLQAARALDVQGGDVLNQQGQMTANGLALNVASLDNTDGLISAGAGNATVAARQQLNNTGGKVEAQKVLDLTAGALDNARGTLIADTVTVNAGTLRNRAGTVSAQQGDLELSVAGLLDNDRGQLQSVHQALRLNAGDLTNRQGTLMARLVTLGVEHTLNNQSGRIVSDGVLTADVNDVLDNTGGTLRGSSVALATGILINNDDGLISADSGDLDIAASDRLINQRGKLQALNAININGGNIDNAAGTLVADRIDIDGLSLANREGVISAEHGALILKTTNGFDNARGHLQATDAASINVGTLDNGEGTITARDITLASDGALDNTAGRIVAQQGDLLVNTSGALQNSEGTLAGNALTLDAESIKANQGGLIAALANNARIRARQTLNNDSGQIQAAGLLTLDAPDITNRAGHLIGQSLTLTGNALDNSGGLVSAEQGNATLTLAHLLNNTEGRLQAGKGMLSLDGGGTLINQRGMAMADQLDIDMADLDNRKGQLVGERLTLQADSLDNGDGGLIAAGQQGATLTLASLANDRGQIQADGRLDIKAATLDNTHGVLLADRLDLNSARLINDSGSMLANAGGIALTLSGEARNRQGMIDSDGGKITIDGDGQTFDNSGGVINGDVLTISTGALSNRSGGQLAGHQIRFIGLKALDNAGGRVLAGTEGLTVEAKEIDNRAGVLQGDHISLVGRHLGNGDNGLIASLDGTLKAVFTQTLDNRNGRMIANGLLDIDPPRIDNRNGQMAGDVVRLEAGTLDNDGGIIEAQKGLALNVDTLNNRSGNLRALGGDSSDFRVAGALDNTRGNIELASRDARIDAASLNNTNGHVVHAGSGLFTLLLKSLDNQGGSLQGTGRAQANIDRINNTGQWQFNGPLSLTTLNALTLTNSDRLASADNLTLEAASLDNRGELLANGNLIFKSAGDITNRGLISAQRQLNITGRNLTQNDGRIASGGGATYRLSGTLDNLGRLTGSDNIDLQAREINNRGTLGSQKNLRLVSQGAINNQADTLLFAGGDMTLRGTRLYNRYGDLYSRGDLDLARDDNGGYADSLENRSGTIEAEGDIRLRVNSLLNTRDAFAVERQATGGRIERGPRYGCKYHRCFDYIMTETSELRITQNSPTGVILAGRDLEIESGGSVVNRYSLLGANHNLTVQSDSLENTGASTGTSTRERQYSVILGGHDNETSQEKRFYENFIDPWNAANGLDEQNNPLPTPLVKEEYDAYIKGRSRLDLLHDTTTNTLDNNSAPATIQAGNRISIRASQRIDNGDISDNKRAQLNGRLAGADKNAPVMGLDYTLNRRTDAAVAVKGSDTRARQRRQMAGTISASEYQNARNESGTAVGRNAPIALNFIPVDYSGLSFERVSPTQLSSFRLPEGQYGLFVKNKAPNSHYLIETNPEFTSADRLMGSDYLLGKLHYTSDGAYKLLGDGRYESRLIRDAVQAKTGSRFLDENLKNDYEQYLYLMNNAIAAQDELHLTTGVALTPSQTAALTHDIVWMEEQEVDGESVLAPVLYLAQVDERNVRGSSLIQGHDIDLIAGNDLANVGTIRASNDLTANSGSSILQGGLMAAGNNLALTAKDDLRNSLAGEIRGRQVDLTTLKGDIVNDRMAVKSGSERRYDTVLDQGGLISATGALNVSAGRDLVNRSDIASGGDLRLSAARDLRLMAVEDARGDDSTYGYRRSSQVQQLGSRVTAANDIALNAGRDIDVIASTVEAGKDLSAAAGQDLNILSGTNSQHDELHYRSSRTKKDVINTVTRQQGSQLTAGNSLTLVADNDLTAQASQLKAGDQAYLVGGNDVQLIAANDQDYHFYQKKKKSGGLISSKSMKRDEVTDTRAVGTTVESGGDLVIASGNDQVYQKARLDAGEDLTLTSGGDITFAAAMDTHSESHEKSKSNWAWQSAKGKGNTDETLRQSELVAQGQLAINAANRVNIDVRDIDQQSVSQTIDAMVAAEPELAWLKQAEAQGDVDWRQVKEIHDRWNYKQSGLGEGAALAVSIAATAAMPGIGTGLTGAMMTAAAGSLAGNSVVGLINNRGNLGATLSDALSSDSLKGALIAAASAGISQGMDSVWGGETDPATGRTIPHDLSSWGGTGRFAGQRASQALADAGLQSAISGGSLNDNLKQSLQGAVTTVLEASLFNLVGDLTKQGAKGSNGQHWADGSAEKTVVHALAGGLASQATGGDFRTGAIAAGANEALINQLDDLVKGDRKLLIAASQITGIVAAGMADGDVQKGAEIAGNATAYNRMMHTSEKEWIEAHGGSEEEKARLTVAAFALIEASAQYEKGSESYNYYKALEDMGNTDAFAAERHKVMSSGLFGYSKWDGIKDSAERYQVANRAWGAVQVGSGIAAGVGSAATVGTGPGMLLGSGMLLWGADNFAAGLPTIINGLPATRFGAQALQQAGISPEMADIIYDLGGMAGAAGLAKFGSSPTVVGNKALESATSHAANDIRFSQNTVSFNKKDRVSGTNYTYDDLVQSMRDNGWKGDPVDVVKMPDRKLTSMDNTRIAAAREAGIDVKATVRDFNDPLTPAVQEARGWQQFDTWGEAITGRIGKQSGGFANNNPYGASEAPRITGSKK
ncbi:hemagglutinin [Kushneria pakistanensis]|uniref:Hemagglutinin n=1 Tax=Kushneria pakistanensis TaxID=1508770 RepID=A0ABQ3FNT8_9GAMM|nr:DUF637 domain-containing protein [Kushneria pakistanensis]GHC31957.1 hemagglutinin [Kushneria pakistanensis]